MSKLLRKLFPPYDREADLARVRRNRFELLELLDNLFHKLGNPPGFGWICDRYDQALIDGSHSPRYRGSRRVDDPYFPPDPYAFSCPVCEGLDYPGLSHNSEAPYCIKGKL
jgi:hypothetical protein